MERYDIGTRQVRTGRAPDAPTAWPELRLYPEKSCQCARSVVNIKTALVPLTNAVQVNLALVRHTSVTQEKYFAYHLNFKL